MRKLYTLIIILIFPLITAAQTTNLPDSETGLSATELADIRSHDNDSKSLMHKVKMLVKNNNSTEKVVPIPPKNILVNPPIVWKTDYLLNPPPIIREEDYDEKK